MDRAGSELGVRTDQIGTQMKTVVTAILGALLLIAGVALLVLPGPGFVLVAAGLAVLATRFEWARKPLDYAKDKAQQGIDEVARSKFRAALALLCALALIAGGLLGIVGLDIPFMNTLSAILLIASGLILIGTVVYARRKGVSGSTEARTWRIARRPARRPGQHAAAAGRARH